MDYDVLGLKVGLQFDEKASLKNLKEKLAEIQRSIKENLNVEVTGIQQAVVDLKGLDESMKVLSSTFKTAFSTIDMGGLAKAMDAINKIDSSVFKKSADATKTETKKQAQELKDYQKVLEGVDGKYKSVTESAKKLDSSLKGITALMKQVDKVGDTRKAVNTDELDGKNFEKYKQQVEGLKKAYDEIAEKQRKSKELEKQLVTAQAEHLALTKKAQDSTKGSFVEKEYQRQAELINKKIEGINGEIKAQGLTSDSIKKVTAEYKVNLDSFNKLVKAREKDAVATEKEKKQAEALKETERRVKAVISAYETLSKKLQGINSEFKKSEGVNRTLTSLSKSADNLSKTNMGEIKTSSLKSAETMVDNLKTKYDLLVQKQADSKSMYERINIALKEQVSLIGKLSGTNLGANSQAEYTKRLEESKKLSSSLLAQAEKEGLVTKEMQGQLALTQKLVEGAERLRQAKMQDAGDAKMLKEQKELESSVRKLTSEYDRLKKKAETIDDDIRGQNKEYQTTLSLIEKIKANLKVEGTEMFNPGAIEAYNAEMQKLVKQVETLSKSQGTKNNSISKYATDLRNLYSQLKSVSTLTGGNAKQSAQATEAQAIREKIEVMKSEIATNGMLTESIQAIITKSEEQLALKGRINAGAQDDRELAKMQQLKTQYDNLGITIQKLQNKMELFKSKTDASFEPEKVQALQQKINALTQAFQTLDATDGKAMASMASDAKKVGSELGTVENKLKIMNNQLGKTSSIFKGVFLGSLFSQLTMMPIQSLRNAVTAVRELDSALTTLSITMNTSEYELESLVTGVRKSALELGTTYEEIMEIAKVYANSQESVQSIMDKIKPTAILATVSGIGAEQATTTVQAVLNQFSSLEGELTEKTERISDVFIAVSRSMAMDFGKGISEMSEGISQSGSVAEQAGVQFEEYVAMLSSTMEITRLTGSQVGNALIYRAI